VKTGHLIMYVFDKNYTRQNAVLTEETCDKTGATLEHFPFKTLTQLPQQAQVSKQQCGK
jgi:hypothetical protein